ncbi:MAG: sel1 repeat family protein [Chloroflexota bacterium]
MNFAKTSLVCLLCLSPALPAMVAAQTLDLAPVYDSAEQDGLPSFEPGSPESDARPGQYYFLLAAHAFQNHEYSYAVNMYKVAASWAYKPAEHNLAVMYALGQGVPVDLPRAAAWMTLAAERKEKTYVHALGLINAQLTEPQFAQAGAILHELIPTYGDKHALLRAKTRWAQVRSSMTGSRVGSQSSPMSVGVFAYGGTTSTFRGQMSSRVVFTPGEVTGSRSVDGSIAYQQLTASNNPYDASFRERSGTATVGDLTTTAADGTHDSHRSSAADADARSQPR